MVMGSARFGGLFCWMRGVVEVCCWSCDRWMLMGSGYGRGEEGCGEYEEKKGEMGKGVGGVAYKGFGRLGS